MYVCKLLKVLMSDWKNPFALYKLRGVAWNGTVLENVEVLAGLGPSRVSAADAVDEGSDPGCGWGSAAHRAHGCPAQLQPNLLQHAHQQLVHVVLDAARRLDELALSGLGQTFALCFNMNSLLGSKMHMCTWRPYRWSIWLWLGPDLLCSPPQSRSSLSCSSPSTNNWAVLEHGQKKTSPSQSTPRCKREGRKWTASFQPETHFFFHQIINCSESYRLHFYLRR